MSYQGIKFVSDWIECHVTQIVKDSVDDDAPSLSVAKKWGAIPPFAQDQILDRVFEGEDELTGVGIRKVLTAFLERDERLVLLD